MRKLHRHNENAAAVLLAVCMLRALSGSGFTCHTIIFLSLLSRSPTQLPVPEYPQLMHFPSLVSKTKFRTYTKLSSYFHGSEFFLRSHQSLSYSRTSQYFMKPECSLPRLQEPLLVPILSQMNQLHTTSPYVS
jgi:hypothetical protein